MRLVNMIARVFLVHPDWGNTMINVFIMLFIPIDLYHDKTGCSTNSPKCERPKLYLY